MSSQVKSRSKSYYDWRSIKLVCLGVELALRFITRYLFLFDSYCLVHVGRSLWREVGSVLSVTVHCQNVIVFTFYMFDMFYLYTAYTIPLTVQAWCNRSCPIICSLRYNGSLDTWRAVRLTAAKYNLSYFGQPMSMSKSKSKSKSYYRWQSVGQSVLESGTHLGPVTNFSPPFFDYF
jgi:hypothetical protein